MTGASTRRSSSRASPLASWPPLPGPNCASRRVQCETLPDVRLVLAQAAALVPALAVAGLAHALHVPRLLRRQPPARPAAAARGRGRARGAVLDVLLFLGVWVVLAVLEALLFSRLLLGVSTDERT